jgi:hypothetical protein
MWQLLIRRNVSYVCVGDREEIRVHHLHYVLREAEITRAVG